MVVFSGLEGGQLSKDLRTSSISPKLDGELLECPPGQPVTGSSTLCRNFPLEFSTRARDNIVVRRDFGNCRGIFPYFPSGQRSRPNPTSVWRLPPYFRSSKFRSSENQRYQLPRCASGSLRNAIVPEILIEIELRSWTATCIGKSKRKFN